MKLTFEEWKRKVNNILIEKYGLGTDDLPDYCYRDAYEDNVSVKTTASAVYRNAKDDMGL